jgi:UDP-N-acetylglucosamine diphosphorylase / glucose-1-phosphate thymidylyltransferase / UDP-N-acetylgalactosamine diphosphorylase / glucosamine-1-phosphate N-acetyltransferase / galactosamine-1-phosphate N-acetyltransferase
MSLELSYYFLQPEKFPIADFLDGITSPAEILTKAKKVLNSLLVEPDVKVNNATVKCGAVIADGNYFIGEGTVIYGDVTIIGPVYIGKDCEIMPGAVIRPNTIIGDKCNVGHGSEIKHAVLFGGAKVASLAFVGDSVLGASARVGSGVITANRKFNQSNVTLKLGGVKHDLGEAYFGVILGDSSRLGANCVTQPGTYIGPHTWVFPMTNVRGFIPKEKRVFHEQKTIMTDNEVVELKP